ncbi:hypothetical protein EMIT0196P_60325 [Pseudomonas chlororaphis]
MGINWRNRLEDSLLRLKGHAIDCPQTGVAHLVLSGCSSKEIARKLQISAETVKVHKKHIYAKLGIKSQSELFLIFLQAQNA